MDRSSAARRALSVTCWNSPASAAPSKPLNIASAPENLSQQEADSRGDRQRRHRLLPDMADDFRLKIACAMLQLLIGLLALGLQGLDAFGGNIARRTRRPACGSFQLLAQPRQLVLQDLNLPVKVLAGRLVEVFLGRDQIVSRRSDHDALSCLFERVPLQRSRASMVPDASVFRQSLIGEAAGTCAVPCNRSELEQYNKRAAGWRLSACARN